MIATTDLRLHEGVQVLLELEDLWVLRELLHGELEALAAPLALGNNLILQTLHHVVQLRQNSLLDLDVAQFEVSVLHLLADGAINVWQ